MKLYHVCLKNEVPNWNLLRVEDQSTFNPDVSYLAVNDLKELVYTFYLDNPNKLPNDVIGLSLVVWNGGKQSRGLANIFLETDVWAC